MSKHKLLRKAFIDIIKITPPEWLQNENNYVIQLVMSCNKDVYTRTLTITGSPSNKTVWELSSGNIP